MRATAKVYWHRDVAMIIFVAAIFIFAVVYSVFSATTIGDNITTAGTLTVSSVSTFSDDAKFTDVHASSTVQATGRAIFYSDVGVATVTPGEELSVVGSGLFTATSTITGGLIAESITAADTLGIYTRGTAAPRMVVGLGGGTNVGIGTSSPGALFSVGGAGLFTATSTILSGGLITEGISAPDTLGFYTRGTAAPRMVVGLGGGASVGIATSSPVTTFSVTGNGYFTGGLGVGKATTGAGTLLVDELAVIEGRLGVFASTSPYQEFGVTGDGVFGGAIGTSSVSLETSTANRSGCLELFDGSADRWIRIYPGSSRSGTAFVASTSGQTHLLVIEAGRCEAGTD